jgi:predicted nucleotidyltransferase
MFHPVLQEKLPEVVALVKAHKVKRAYAFGSICTPEFNNNSDVDLLISFDDALEPADKGELWFELYFKLKDVFNREVDLLTESSLGNPYFINTLNRTKTALYE